MSAMSLCTFKGADYVKHIYDNILENLTEVIICALLLTFQKVCI